MPTTVGFRPPPYPFDRLDDLHALARQHDGGAIDLSIGSPVDATPDVVLAALAGSARTPGYPPSAGTTDVRRAASRWVERRFGVRVDADGEVAACVGSKEFVASTPQYLRLRRPERDTVLYPAVSYPTYEMGAVLGGCRAVPYGRLTDIASDDAARAVCLWVNTPSNPTGELVDVAAAAEWGRTHDVPVLVDECYTEFTWNEEPATVLATGLDGVLAVHSLSKRSNFAGGRFGFYAGDADLVGYLQEVRRHAGLVPPGPVQDAAVAALDDDHHVQRQRTLYHERIGLLVDLLRAADVDAERPAGGFFVWARAPGDDAWKLARRLARQAAVVVSPGELYGPSATAWVRLAAVQPAARLELAIDRLRRS